MRLFVCVGHKNCLAHKQHKRTRTEADILDMCETTVRFETPFNGSQEKHTRGRDAQLWQYCSVQQAHVDEGVYMVGKGAKEKVRVENTQTLHVCISALSEVIKRICESNEKGVAQLRWETQVVITTYQLTLPLGRLHLGLYKGVRYEKRKKGKSDGSLDARLGHKRETGGGKGVPREEHDIKVR